MPFALLLIGIWLLVAGVRNTAGPASQSGTLFALVHGDLTGPDNFAYWFIAIILIGAIGYIPKLKPLSTAFLALVVVVLFLKKGNSNGVGGGFFNQFISGIGVTANTTTFGNVTTSLGTGSASDQLNALQTRLDQVQAAAQANLGPR